MRTNVVLAGLAAALTSLTATPASSCVPVVRPSATAEDFAREEVERQQALWREADLVFVAIVAGRTSEKRHTLDFKVRLRVHPKRPLKGALPPQDFDLATTGWTSCGLAPFFDIFDLDGKDEFVVFVKGPYPAQDRVLDTRSIGRVTAPEVQSLLKALGYASR